MNDKKTAGVYYVPIADGYSANGVSDVSFGKGRTLDNEEIILKQDKSFSGGVSEYLQISVKTHNKLTEEEINCYKQYALSVAEKGAKEMFDGVIVPSPIGDACEYCPFGAMCGDDVKTREIKKVDKETIKHSVTGEKDGK